MNPSPLAVSLLLLPALALAQPAERPSSEDRGLVELRPGVTRTLKVSELTRVAVGDSSIVNVKVSGPGDLELTALSPGRTTLLVWLKDGTRVSYLLAVRGEPTRPGAPNETVSLAPAEARVLELKGVTRLAIGDPSIADVTTVGNGEVLLTARSSGVTTLLVWRGERPVYTIRVEVR
jgi:Flp pilus assembly secretin CpaC